MELELILVTTAVGLEKGLALFKMGMSSSFFRSCSLLEICFVI